MQKIKQFTFVTLLTFYFEAVNSQETVLLSAFDNSLSCSMRVYFEPDEPPFPLTMEKDSRSTFYANVKTEPDIWYKGRVIRSKGTCKWLIRITDAKDTSLMGKLIEPTGIIPKIYQKRGTRLRFEMTPLRQAVPEGCKADFVASLVNLTKE
ncbi:MAG: hypothetical protein ACK5CV_07345 [Bacteroidota bacterium]|jgi:hypothetical protein